MCPRSSKLCLRVPERISIEATKRALSITQRANLEMPTPHDPTVSEASGQATGHNFETQKPKIIAQASSHIRQELSKFDVQGITYYLLPASVQSISARLQLFTATTSQEIPDISTQGYEAVDKTSGAHICPSSSDWYEPRMSLPRIPHHRSYTWSAISTHDSSVASCFVRRPPKQRKYYSHSHYAVFRTLHSHHTAPHHTAHTRVPMQAMPPQLPNQPRSLRFVTNNPSARSGPRLQPSSRPVRNELAVPHQPSNNPHSSSVHVQIQNAPALPRHGSSDQTRQKKIEAPENRRVSSETQRNGYI